MKCKYCWFGDGKVSHEDGCIKGICYMWDNSKRNGTAIWSVDQKIEA